MDGVVGSRRDTERHRLTITVYGIRNCDTMKRARAWLEAHGIAYVFHDYKTAGIDRATLEKWVAEAGWEKLLNRSGTTFRKLPEADRANLDERRAVAATRRRRGSRGVERCRRGWRDRRRDS